MLELEGQSTADLHGSAADRYAGDLSCLRAADIIIGLRKAGMVQHVGGIPAELEVDLSPDDEVLAQRKVDVRQARTAQAISA